MIPKYFTVMGRTYTVRILSKGDWQEDEDTVGLCDSEKSELRIKELPSLDATEQVFYHEMIHAVLTAMNHKLNHDEAFVDVFGGLLHQVMKTAQYDQ